MKLPIRSILAAGALAAALLGTSACSGTTETTGTTAGHGAQAAVVVQTSFPGLPAAAGEPTLASLKQARPKPGTVVQASGPFDNRFKLDRPALKDGAVTGTITVTSDVSDLLELEVVAGFYDKDRTLLGTGRFVHHAGADGHAHSGPPSETEEFSVRVPKDLADKTVSAAVGVPVLVNE
ncbi:hypothetical protein QO003_003301 [Arthrobacter silviterrae]|uniref:Uncharacterized protein n=1 Tax=Arthrobacter silviterrae TaxID=2026658 RepID=A0ABX0DEF4_9MICC|nr:hypothetical protein [Arthrobacter silviterrae]MDQ0278998.1 hypothetical protein [Arthrobacter silviterrae]NGN85316.1 hypothetical protein [Arthrobacter silviterrae]